MKKLFVIFGLLLSGFVNAQTIGDHLNDVMKEKPGGSLSTTGSTNYGVKSDISLTVYFFNENLSCDKIAIVPKTTLDIQGYVESFNRNWVIVDSKHWKFYKPDGTVLGCFMYYVDDVGMAFMITELEPSENDSNSTGGTHN